MSVFHTGPFIDQNIAIDVGRGNIRAITGTNPAAGAEISETVPAGKLWVLQWFSATLVAEVTPANRTMRIVAQRGGTPGWVWLSSVNQLATQTRIYTLMRLRGEQPTANISVYIFGGIPDFVLLAGDVITTSTINLQAADDWSAPYYQVQEFDV